MPDPPDDPPPRFLLHESHQYPPSRVPSPRNAGARRPLAVTANRHTGPWYGGRPIDVVIDVRSRLEFWFGHLDGATCMPVGAIVARLEQHPTIGRDTRILLYCASGSRSAVAAETLRVLGYRHVTDGGAMSAAATRLKPPSSGG